MIKLTLGYDSDERKATPLLKVCFGYFAAAMAGLTRHAVRSNTKHNPGEPVHWARGKSMDHDECSLRHLVDSSEIRAWLRNNPTHPDRETVVTMLEHEVDAKVWRAAAESQEFYEEFRGAPLSAASALPGRVVTPPTPEQLSTAAATVAMMPKALKLPQVADGTPHGANWCVVDGDGNLISLHATFEEADDKLRELLGFPGPVNTPGEAAELAKAQGTIKIVARATEDGTPIYESHNWLTTGFASGNDDEPLGELDLAALAPNVDPQLAHGFPLFADCPSERGNIVDAPVAPIPAEPFERCGHMSNTKRVCTMPAGHVLPHSDAFTLWYPIG